MVSRKNYNLNANEGFVICLTSKLITCFIGGFKNFFLGEWPSRMHEQ